MVVLDLAGLFFGVRMLLSCFQDKEKFPFLQRYRLPVLCQFVYQVIILTTNTVEIRNVLSLKYQETTCSVLNFLTISVNLLLICNAIAMIVIHFKFAVLVFEGSLPSQQLVMTTAIVVSCVFAAILSVFDCFCLYCDSHAAVLVFVWFSFSAVVIFVGWKASKDIFHQEQLNCEGSSKQSHSPICFAAEKVVFYSLCFGVMMMLVCLYFYQSIEKHDWFQKTAVNLLAVNFIAGVIFPSSFKDLIDSNYEHQNSERIFALVVEKI